MKINKTIDFDVPYSEGQHLWKLCNNRLEVEELIVEGWRMDAHYSCENGISKDSVRLSIICKNITGVSYANFSINDNHDFIFAEKNKAYQQQKIELLKTLQWTIDIFGEGHERINSPTCLTFFQEAQESYKNIDGNPYFDEPGSIDRKVKMVVDRFVKSAENIAGQLNIMKPRFEEKTETTDPFISGGTA